MTKTTGAWIGALPSNPMAAVFKDAQDRAMQIAKENAELVFTFAGKISNAQTPQILRRFRCSLLKTGCRPSSCKRRSFNG